MKAIQLLINSYLPEDLRDYSRSYDAKDMNKLLSRVAHEYPDRFADILKKVSDLGRKASWLQGETITLQDFMPVIDKAAIYEQMDAEIDALPKDKNYKQRRQEIFQKYNTLIEKETAKNALANRNDIAMAVLSGARGKNPQLKAMISTPGTFSDYKGRPIDLFSRESFAEGIRPATFLASTYGARSSVISTKCIEHQTLVRMADLSTKKICDIQVGEEVLGADREGNTFPVKVLNVFDQGMQRVRLYCFTCEMYTWRPVDPSYGIAVKVHTTKQVEVVCTEEHKFLRSKVGEVIPMKDFVSDAEEVAARPLVACILKNSLTSGFLTSISAPQEAHCYDIEVDHPDHLFVLANGLITSNSSTAKGGDWAKQMASAATDMIIRKENCGSYNGIPLGIDDASLKGRALAKETAGIPAGTFIDREVLRKLEKAGKKTVVVRSPLTCNVPNGLCAHCVGKFYNGGKLPKVGDAIGALAASTSSEPVCLVKGTLVRMADGTAKAIEYIKPGDMVLGSDENAHCSPVKVVNVFHNGMRDCYRTGVKKGRGGASEIVYLNSTKEHKTLSYLHRVKDGMSAVKPCIRPIGEMPNTSSNMLYCQFPLSYSGGRQEPFAMLLGMLVGDGSYKGTASGSAGVGVRFSCYDDEQIAALRENLKPLNLRVQYYTDAHEFRIVAENQYDKTQWTYDKYGNYIRNKARAKLIEEGMWGQDCYTKTLPKSIWEWDHVSVCAFVGGLIATDGHITKDGARVGYSSNNKELLAQIRLLLETRLGVYSTRISSSTKRKDDDTTYNPTYSFQISEASSIRNLAQQVTVPGRKDALLKKAAERHAKSKCGLFRVVSQRHLGMRDTYDIEVANDSHLFVLANGLIVSNTQMALCLGEDTPVQMSDGSTKPIKDIQVGEEVLGADREGNTFPVKVLNVFDQGLKNCFRYEWRPKEISDIISASVICTPDHKFLRANGEVIPVNVRKYGSQLREYSTSTSGEKLYIDLAAESVGKVRCFDIEVDHPDHLFVLANGLITHNSAKHTAGMTQGKRSYSGLEYIQQFTQSPEAFKDRAAVSELDGTVEAVDEAPQGGLYITVSGEKHYVPAGHEAIVKQGDEVEAGDQLSEGLVDPEDIIRLKGIGEGRRYYAERLNQMLGDSGAATDKRNTEVLARAAIRHIRVTDPEGMGVYLPDDVADYNAVQSSYMLPETARVMRSKEALGKYLQQPVLHYSIGTRITPKVIKELVAHDYNDVWADDVAPAFEPEMIRLRTSSHTTRDWLASMGTSYLAKQLNESATRGDDTNVKENDDYRPRLAIGVGFGDNVRETGKF